MVRNVPRIRDVESQIAVLEGLGVKRPVERRNELRLHAD